MGLSTIRAPLLFNVPVPNTFERHLSSFPWVRRPLVYCWGQLGPQDWVVPGISSPVLGLSYAIDYGSVSWEMSYAGWLQSRTEEQFPLNYAYPTWLSAWKNPQTTHNILETQWELDGVLSLSSSSCVTSGCSLNLSESQFSHLQNGN